MATGRAARERLERAWAVSALVDTDAAARDAFLGAYTGRGDAIGALAALLRGNPADPDRTASLDRHRRSAFARPDGPADEAAAADALVALRRDAEKSDADAAALDRAIAVVLERDIERLATERAAAPDPAAPSPAAPQTRRWLRPVLAAAVIVAAIALGAGGESLVSGALAGPEPVDTGPSPITYFRDPAARDADPTGDTEAADRWFEDEQTAEDAYPAPFDGVDPGSTRVVHTGTDGRQVWVGRGTNSEYCLLTYTESEQMGAAGCTDPESFTRAGAGVSTGGITVTWTGAELTVQIGRR